MFTTSVAQAAIHDGLPLCLLVIAWRMLCGKHYYMQQYYQQNTK